MFKYYEHHGVWVWAKEDLIGKHRKHCLCWSCDYFKPGVPEENCIIANLVYAVCLSQNLVLPVWECPVFVEKDEA